MARRLYRAEERLQDVLRFRNVPYDALAAADRGGSAATRDRPIASLLGFAATLARRGGDRIELAHALLWPGRCRARAGDTGSAADALGAAQAQLAGAREFPAWSSSRAFASVIREVPAEAPAQPGAGDGELLSTAELRLLELLPSELSYREIAERL